MANLELKKKPFLFCGRFLSSFLEENRHHYLCLKSTKQKCLRQITKCETTQKFLPTWWRLYINYLYLPVSVITSISILWTSMKTHLPFKLVMNCASVIRLFTFGLCRSVFNMTIAKDKIRIASTAPCSDDGLQLTYCSAKSWNQGVCRVTFQKLNDSLHDRFSLSA